MQMTTMKIGKDLRQQLDAARDVLNEELSEQGVQLRTRDDVVRLMVARMFADNASIARGEVPQRFGTDDKRTNGICSVRP